MIDWMVRNKEWIFSGIGVTVLVSVCGIIKFVIKPKGEANIKIIQRQQNFQNSHGTQIGIQNDYNYIGKSNERY